MVYVARALVLRDGDRAGLDRLTRGRASWASLAVRARTVLLASEDEHTDKIPDPEGRIEGWDELDPRRQQALLDSKWPGDIARQQAQLDLL
jgi:hypothetical protein